MVWTPLFWDKLDGCHTRTTQQEAVWRHIFRPLLIDFGVFGHNRLPLAGIPFPRWNSRTDMRIRKCHQPPSKPRASRKRVKFQVPVAENLFSCRWWVKERREKGGKVEIHPRIYPCSVGADPNDIPCKINFSITFGALVFCSRGQLLLQYKPPPLGLEREKKKREKLSKWIQPRSNSFHRGSGCY